METSKQSQKAESLLAPVVAHPLRTRCLTVLAERTASPNELKDILRVPLGDAAYHVKRLLDLGVIELVQTRQVRGAVEHFYRAIERPLLSDQEVAAMQIEERLDINVYACQLAFADISRAIDEKVFCRRPDQHVTRVPMLVDEQGWEELRALHAEHLQRVLDIQAASAARMAEAGDGEQIHATAFTTFFERPTPSAGRTA